MIGRKDRLVASALGTAGSKIGETDEEQGWISWLWAGGFPPPSVHHLILSRPPPYPALMYRPCLLPPTCTTLLPRVICTKALFYPMYFFTSDISRCLQGEKSAQYSIVRQEETAGGSVVAAEGGRAGWLQIGGTDVASASFPHNTQAEHI